MKVRLAVAIAGSVVVACSGFMVATAAGSATGARSPVSVRPGRTAVPAAGGLVTLHATLKGKASHCKWSSRPTLKHFAATVKCSSKMKRSARLPRNTSESARRYTFKLTAVLTKTHKTVTGETTVRQDGRPAPPTTTTTTTTVAACKVGSCTVTFAGGPDLADAVSLAVTAVAQGASCPSAGLCSTPSGDQLDAVAIKMTAGSAGMAPASEIDNFGLVVSGGSGSLDTVNFVPAVSSSLAGVGAVAPGSSFTADVYFDVPTGKPYTSVTFAYTSQSGTTATYTWTP